MEHLTFLVSFQFRNIGLDLFEYEEVEVRRHTAFIKTFDVEKPIVNWQYSLIG
jgi:hypothetical protein